MIWMRNNKDRVQTYMFKLSQALMGNPYNNLFNPDSIYYGLEGHKRLAREVGYALNDFNDRERKDLLSASYSQIYVRACNLRPLLDAREWQDIMKAQIKEVKEE